MQAGSAVRIPYDRLVLRLFCKFPEKRLLVVGFFRSLRRSRLEADWMATPDHGPATRKEKQETQRQGMSPNKWPNI